MGDHNTNPGNRDVADLERDVDAEREQVSQTIDALQAKADLGNVVDQIVKAVGKNGGEVSRNLGRTLRDNPLPALLTGVGLAWLMAGSGRPAYRYGRDYAGPDYDDWESSDDEYRYRGFSGVATGRISSAPSYVGSDGEAPSSDTPGIGERAASVANDLRDRAAGTASDLRAKAEDTAQGTRDMARDVGEAARMRASAARRRTSRLGHDAQERVDDMMQDQPLVLGALALAVGAAIGGALPRSRAEDRMFGEHADRAKDEIRSLAESEGRKVKATAEAVADEARSIADESVSEAGERLPSGSEIVDKADRRAREAADRLKQAGSSEAERQNLGGPSQNT
jgi:hypothetical protein